jgi:predicted transposase/invertase (TIGR01784 family)
MLLTEYDYDTDIAVQRQEAYEDGMEQGISQGIQQGSQQAKIETAKNMLKDNLDIQTILKYTGLSIEEIKSLAK